MSLSTLTVILAIAMQACAVWHPLVVPLKPDTVDCERFFRDMDDKVEAFTVADAGTARIEGFPALRANRFLASFANADLTERAYAAWLERLRKLDETARLIEWRNLPDRAKSALPALAETEIVETVSGCGRILTQPLKHSSGQRALLFSKIQPPDAYSTWQRLFGLYFLTRWAIVDGVRQLQQEIREPFLETGQPPVEGRLISYAPPASGTMPTAEAANILQLSAANPLGIPEPSASQLEQLFSAYAPAWLVDTRDDNDRIATVEMASDGQALIDTRQPRVYRLPSHTRVGKQVLLQLNYVVWFPARPPTSPLDIYAGRFDGLIWRVTLRMDGRPLAYDSIHPCGCYYQIFPGAGMRVRQPQDGSEPILTPTPLLAHQPGERVVVKIAAGNHFITGIATQQPTADSEQYGWLDYDALRSLPIPNDGYRSLFDEDGLVPGSERAERFLLWPMGVPSSGAMRQWGTHAIAFLGKRHFDDPRLLDKLLRPLWE
ncbi:MAG: hypothetical protein M0R33_09355 [Methylomonas sp.]|uniref:hypothetical protein n=1 Tax=Methylomonas sp. TaxID=418 RepID=UPI0026006E16|nr:hypothetical protein [Methylomonas sp.]MCK9606642.1 hypothetical protein [Methylomonas sp.]